MITKSWVILSLGRRRHRAERVSRLLGARRRLVCRQESLPNRRVVHPNHQINWGRRGRGRLWVLSTGTELEDWRWVLATEAALLLSTREAKKRMN
ncbi:unnamed protein product [Linum trigynum]|uniref:Uncharacterized protein n=1 Tax=Linum trigynum TaxID=586398 RepID=A0AAV2DAM5_9ROSI